MTRQELRGRFLFLFLAIILIAHKLYGVGSVLTGDLSNVNWLRAVVLPLGFCAAVAFVWDGDNWLRWLVGIAVMFYGGSIVYLCARLGFAFAEVTRPEQAGFVVGIVGIPIGFLGIVGSFYVVAGLLLLVSPSIRAFCQRQRDRKTMWWVQ